MASPRAMASLSRSELLGLWSLVLAAAFDQYLGSTPARLTRGVSAQ